MSGISTALPVRMRVNHLLPFGAALIVGLLSVQFAACGGGGSSLAGGRDGSGSNSGSGGGTGGSGAGPPGACGLSQAKGVKLPGPAEGAWSGAFPFLFGYDVVFGNGVVTADGTAVFNVANRELWVGSVLASEEGSVVSNLARYERPNTGGAGGPRSAGTPVPEALAFDLAVERKTLAGAYLGPLSDCQGMSLGYDDVYQHAASLQEIAGVYTATEEDGYALTVTVHEDGGLDGGDTRGCMLIGDVTVPDSAKNVYRATASASACGDLDGPYEGILSLRISENRLSWLDLALAARDTAIFYRLSR